MRTARLSAGARAVGFLRKRAIPSTVKRFLRRFRVINQLVPPLTGGELSVRLAASDLIRRGDVVFDVGANIGSHTLFMARLVGRNGHVHAFEPNEQCLARLERSLRTNGISNCTVVHAAVVEAGGGFADLYLDERPGMDGVASTVCQEAVNQSRLGPGPIRSVRVPTICLDDYCASNQAAPRLIKLDVENAELMALKGARRTIEAERPHLILEYGNEVEASSTSLFIPANPTLHFLAELGYELIDLSLYETVNLEEYISRRMLRNILAIHRSQRPETPYWNLDVRECLTIRRDDLLVRDLGLGLFESRKVLLEPGRYVASFHLDARGEPEIEVACLAAGELITGATFGFSFLMLGLHHLVFELTAATATSFRAARKSPGGTLEVDRICVRRVVLGAERVS